MKKEKIYKNFVLITENSICFYVSNQYIFCRHDECVFDNNVHFIIIITNQTIITLRTLLLNTLYLPAGSWAISISSSHMSTLLQSIVLNILKEIVIAMLYYGHLCTPSKPVLIFGYLHMVLYLNRKKHPHGIRTRKQSLNAWSKVACWLGWNKCDEGVGASEP